MDGWRVLRERLRITHLDPVERRIVVELTLRNEGDAAQDFVMELHAYLPGLCVRDAAGREMPFLPRHDVRALMRRGAAPRDADEEAALDALASRLLWVVLPEPVPHGGVLVLTLAYEDRIRPTTGRGPLRRPRFHVAEEKGEAEAHATVIEVRAPPESRLRLERWAAPEAHGAQTRFTSNETFLQVRVPPGVRAVRFDYSVNPARREEALLLAMLAVLTLVPLALEALQWFPALRWKVPFLPYALRAPDAAFSTEVGLFGASAIFAALGLTQPKWFNRLYYLVPFLAYLLLALTSPQPGP